MHFNDFCNVQIESYVMYATDFFKNHYNIEVESTVSFAD